MTVSVRFPPRIEQELIKYSVSQSMTKSEVLIQAVTQYLGSVEARTGLKGLPGAKQDASPIYQRLRPAASLAK